MAQFWAKFTPNLPPENFLIYMLGLPGAADSAVSPVARSTVRSLRRLERRVPDSKVMNGAIREY